MPYFEQTHEGDSEVVLTTANVPPDEPVVYSVPDPKGYGHPRDRGLHIVFDVVPRMPPEDADRSPIWVSLAGDWTREDPSGH